MTHQKVCEEITKNFTEGWQSKPKIQIILLSLRIKELTNKYKWNQIYSSSKSENCHPKNKTQLSLMRENMCRSNDAIPNYVKQSKDSISELLSFDLH